MTNSSTTVIGLSAFPEEISDSRARFEELGVLITKFDLEDAWAKTIARYVSEVKGRVGTRIDVDFVIVCALEEERSGFQNTGLRKISETILSGLNIHYVDKCVVDLADADKNDDLHAYGAVVSARAAEQIIRALIPTTQKVE